MRWLQVVGPTSVDVAKPLPTDLEAFLERGRAAQHGAIYISMGSVARLTEQELQSLADCVSALPNPVIWKLSALDLPSKHTFLCLPSLPYWPAVEMYFHLLLRSLHSWAFVVSF